MNIDDVITNPIVTSPAQLAEALHDRCLRRWASITDKDRQITMHQADAHLEDAREMMDWLLIRQ